MHILGFLAFLMALLVALEVIRQTLVANGERILDAMAGIAFQSVDAHPRDDVRVLPFRSRTAPSGTALQTLRMAA